mgnify:CR=1 FL=1
MIEPLSDERIDQMIADLIDQDLLAERNRIEKQAREHRDAARKFEADLAAVKKRLGDIDRIACQGVRSGDTAATDAATDEELRFKKRGEVLTAEIEKEQKQAARCGEHAKTLSRQMAEALTQALLRDGSPREVVGAEIGRLLTEAFRLEDRWLERLYEQKKSFRCVQPSDSRTDTPPIAIPEDFPTPRGGDLTLRRGLGSMAFRAGEALNRRRFATPDRLTLEQGGPSQGTELTPGAE